MYKVLAGCMLLAVSTMSEAQVYRKSNGIISYDANAYGIPMISNLSILGTRVMPYDNAGAGFQMTGRSAAGNAYNPTQAGDCTQKPSQVISIVDNWAGSGTNINPSNSLLFSVAPRNYNEPVTCQGTGAVLPFSFEFGATLGDGATLPKEGMLLDMYYTRWSGAEVLDKAQSEAPSIFPHLETLPHAYWSADGVTIQPFRVQVGSSYTNDMRYWPTGTNFYATGKLVMACTATRSNCLALYSDKTTTLLMSRRRGAAYNLSLLTLTVDTSGVIDDYQTHHARKLLAVGTPDTVTAVIRHAKQTITNWGDL
jgi:hypothetical protein